MNLTIKQFEEETRAAAQEIQRRVRALVGRKIKVLSDYNGQCYGSSKPSQKGKTLTIASASVNDSGYLTVRPVEFNVYMRADEFELVGDQAVIEEKH
ncbi:hypothetical protein HMH05_03110 [Pseudomonas sp. SbB1]|uniref:Uncharacterized protein n=1 Tax=Pseudomonas putida (strain GB-1) TaxID=76869 RepID=B0KKM2_PSEPG|nr:MULTISPECIES: hypothetical protein [Pseudomonas]ABY99326.1 hypothetical protein PputGB1_3435 [Pseudomonas putida GB-1]MBP0706940.1 hypothetical protein [Pseudomonas sp. T34]MCK2186378.1 hypothetical protein [Pseudomonas sp. MB04B]MDD2083515.1 hypothetical protein [Pseudomonas putida]MDD2093583.1 hypothetical protein [Pseudomonas putida]